MAVAAVIHWKSSEAEPVLAACRKSGLTVKYMEGDGMAVCRGVRNCQPDVLVIDLSRRPSHSRAVASYLRQTKATRHIPLVFAGGDPEKVQKVREMLPDAVYCSIPEAGTAAKRAAKRGSRPDAVTPPGIMEQYRGKTAAEKLGITAGASVCVVDPPRDFPALLGTLPNGVDFREEPAPLTLWFVEELDQLLSSLRRMRAEAAHTRLWVLWRKGSNNGLTQNSLREATREVGLVDYKICAVDDRWSAMLFTRKAVRKSA